MFSMICRLLGTSLLTEFFFQQEEAVLVLPDRVSMLPVYSSTPSPVAGQTPREGELQEIYKTESSIST